MLVDSPGMIDSPEGHTKIGSGANGGLAGLGAADRGLAGGGLAGVSGERGCDRLEYIEWIDCSRILVVF